MTGSDDDLGLGLDDDPSLQSMRDVWRSMRDEEPPAAGLAALMTAARAQAAAMQPKEPWWSRALAALRRPPVLAFATVVLLLGGAVMISSRRDELEVRPVAESAEPPARGAGTERAYMAGGAGAENAESAGSAGELGRDKLEKDQSVEAKPADGAAAGPGPAPGADEGIRSEREAPAAVDRVERPAPRATALRRPTAPAPAPGRGGEENQKPADRVDDSEGGANDEGAKADPVAPTSTPPPAPPPPPPAMTPTGAGPGGEVLADRNTKAPEAAPGKATKGAKPATSKQDLQIAEDSAAGAPAEAISTTGSVRPSPDSQRAGKESGPSIDQLAKQAAAAAARGDCAAVRAILEQIRKRDAAAYRAQIGRSDAVKRCVK